MSFNFSIRSAFKDSWNIFAKHMWFFLGLAFVLIIFNVFYGTNHVHTTHQGVLTAVVVIAMFLWAYVWISAALAAVDKKDAILNFRSLSTHMPTLRQFLMFVLIGIVVGLIVGVGIVLLIIPGIYFMTRLVFSTFAYVDRNQSVGKSLSYSWHLVKGKIFWTTFLVLIIYFVLIFIGNLALVIGALITYPLAVLLLAHLYRALSNYHEGIAAASE